MMSDKAFGTSPPPLHTAYHRISKGKGGSPRRCNPVQTPFQVPSVTVKVNSSAMNPLCAQRGHSNSLFYLTNTTRCKISIGDNQIL